MISTVKNLWRLARAGRTMARYDFFLQPEQVSDLPWFARALLKTAKFGAAAPVVDSGSRVTAALSSLGRATSTWTGSVYPPDVIGAKRALSEIPAGPPAALQMSKRARHPAQSRPER